MQNSFQFCCPVCGQKYYGGFEDLKKYFKVASSEINGLGEDFRDDPDCAEANLVFRCIRCGKSLVL